MRRVEADEARLLGEGGDEGEDAEGDGEHGAIGRERQRRDEHDCGDKRRVDALGGAILVNRWPDRENGESTLDEVANALRQREIKDAQSEVFAHV